MATKNLLKKKFTKSLMIEMAEHLAAHRFNPIIAQIEAEISEAAVKVYEAHYDKDLKQMESLPKGWLKEKTCFYAYAVDKEGKNVSALTFKEYYEPNSYDRSRTGKQCGERSRECVKVTLPNYRRFKARDDNNLYLPFDNEHLQKFCELLTKLTEAKVEQEDFEQEMYNYLQLAENFEVLYERWPAVRELLREFEPVPTEPKKKVLPPATLFDDLNKKLGIPTEKAMVATTA